MNKMWQISFSFSSLFVASFIGILAFIGAQRNEKALGINIQITISSLVLLTLIFFLIKVVQKKPRYWIRVINKALLIPIVPLTLLSLIMSITTPENPQKVDTLVNLFLLIIALWGVFALITLVKLLKIEKKHFNEKGVLKTIISIDKSINTLGSKFTEKYPTLASLVAIAIIAGIVIYLYIILGISK